MESKKENHLIHHLSQGIVRIPTALKDAPIIPHKPVSEQVGKMKEEVVIATRIIDAWCSDGLGRWRKPDSPHQSDDLN